MTLQLESSQFANRKDYLAYPTILDEIMHLFILSALSQALTSGFIQVGN